MHDEGQELRNLEQSCPGFSFRVNPHPSFDDFEKRIPFARSDKARGLHLAGHGLECWGFLWLNKRVNAATRYEKIDINRIARVVKCETPSGGGGVIDFSMLNALSTKFEHHAPRVEQNP